MKKVVLLTALIALAGCASHDVPPQWIGGAGQDNALRLPDGSDVRVFKAMTPADDPGLYQFTELGTVRTYPGGHSDVVAITPYYHGSAGGVMLGTMAGMAGMAVDGMGAAALLPRPKGATITATASPTITASGGAGGSATGGTASGGNAYARGGNATGGNAIAHAASLAAASAQAKSRAQSNPTVTNSNTVAPTIAPSLSNSLIPTTVVDP